MAVAMAEVGQFFVPAGGDSTAAFRPLGTDGSEGYQSRSGPTARGGAHERRPSPLVYFLFGVFGWSSWLTINAAFIQLPVFAAVLPESTSNTCRCWTKAALTVAVCAV